jgi:hypothetical protein
VTAMPTDDRSVSELIASLCDETITPEELQRLDRLLCGDAEVRRLYLEHLDVHARLSYQLHELGETASRDAAGVPKSDAQGLAASHLPLSALPPSIVPSHFFTGGAVASYAIAVLIVCLAGLAAWNWRTSGDSRPMAGSTTLSTVSQVADSRLDGKGAAVGRITAMKDCRWVDSAAPTENGADVRLGRKYHLAAGSLEITYNSGAKVTLHGPAVFDVDSPIGGFLKSGRLTARGDTVGPAVVAEDPAEKRRVVERPFLCIRVPNPVAPMMLVADRAAEFRVSIEQPLNTSVHLVRGLVVARLPSVTSVRETTVPELGATVATGGTATYRFEMYSGIQSEASGLAAQPTTGPVYSAGKKEGKNLREEKKKRADTPTS